MSPKEKDELVAAIMVALREDGCTIHGHCQTFDAETIQAIKNAAIGYSRLTQAGRWAGGLIAGVVLATIAAGFCAALWKGFCAMAHLE